ncbi:serine/threonine-protein kinase haspin homolog [Haemaphysalis longicornis]
MYQRHKPQFRDLKDRHQALVWSEIAYLRNTLLDHRSVGHFIEVNFKSDEVDADKFTMMSDSRYAEVYRVQSYKGDSVLKLVKLDNVLKFWNRLISEVLISNITCVLDNDPDELRKPKNIAATDKEHVQRAYLAWHMTSAGVPLDKFKFTNVLQLWSILQQIALTLAVAEEALQFEHRDLRLDRVLVGATREEKAKFIIFGRNLTVKTRGVEARITGFASSRITDGDTPIFTELDDLFERPTGHKVQFAYKHMTSIIRNEWHHFHPLTNLLFLLYITKEMYRRYTPNFRDVKDRYHALAWSEIACMRNTLLDYRSVGHFIEVAFKSDWE